MSYYFIIALQLACAYHVYKTHNNTYWYFVILFIPALGSIVYIITQMIRRQHVESVQKDIIHTFNPTKKVKDLEQQVAFADTFQNRLLLADGYAEMRAFAKAEVEYLMILKGSHANDYYGQCQLLATFYAQEKYIEAIEIGKKLEVNPAFEGSPTQFTYGLSLAKAKDFEAAENVLKKIDKRYSNYRERLILAEYFIDQKRDEEANEILTELRSEGVNMTKPNRRLYRETFARIDVLFNKLNTPTR